MPSFSRRSFMAAGIAALTANADTPQLPVRHPRVLITPEMVKEMVRKVRGAFANEYALMLETAKMGPVGLEQEYATPGAFVEAALAYLIETESGRDGKPYAEKILSIWRQPEWQKPGLARHFGWQGLAYDWIYDAMTPDDRSRFGRLLGEWVATWWKTAEVNIEREGWWYNQHWGPVHLDVPHNRVALTSKLFMSLAAQSNAGPFEKAVQTNLDDFYTKFRQVGLPALDEMGGIWSESNGHGGYGPTLVIPFSYQAVKTGMGFDPFEASAANGFAREYIRAGIYSLMPHNDKMSYIDDSSSGYPVQYVRCAPLFARNYRDGVARWLSDIALEKHWLRHPKLAKDEVWHRIAFLPSDLKPVSPGQARWPLAYLFRGAGHVYMRSAWDDPNATWAFFGAGPSYAGHSRDDEGHFLICKRSQLVNRSGGRGHNDGCYYSGGSLIYNIVTVYHPEEKMRRTNYNENDGGLVRHVYEHGFPKERGHITAYSHDPKIATYAAADLTKGYWSGKVREVTRQFLYLRGKQEAFVIFDRVEATSRDWPKTWFLHIPGEPSVSGTESVKVAGHVFEYDGDTATWLSDAAGDTDLLSQGKSRMVLRTLAPTGSRVVKRGGAGHDFWGNRHNPDAQYNHVLDKDGREQRAYRQPPFSPWRIEVEPPQPQERDCFLHVMHVMDEGDSEAPKAERIEKGGQIGARVKLGNQEVTVLFDTSGAIGGRLTIRRGNKVVHDAPLATSVITN